MLRFQIRFSNKHFKLIFFNFILICFLLFLNSIHVSAADSANFEGKGTQESPYLISSAKELKHLQKLVNSGNDFQGCYFQQTANIDLENKKMSPIGNEEYAFYGHYDGNGYYIENLSVEYNEKESGLYSGFFGVLGGTVSNLGIKSGNISGIYSGSIAGTSVGTNAAIINCYSKASIQGSFAGGIAAKFVEGTIANCYSIGSLDGEQTGGIVAFGGDVKLYGCYTTNSPIAPADVVSTTSYIVTNKELFSKQFANKMSIQTGLSQFLFANRYNIELKEWTFDGTNLLNNSDSNTYIKLFYFINYYLLLIVLIIILFVFFFKLYKAGFSNIWELFSQQIKSIMIVSGCISIFLDTAFIAKGLSCLKLGNTLFLVLINFIFICTLFCTVKNQTVRKMRYQNRDFPLMLVIAITLSLELLQFELIPKYDACLYYGSLMKGCELFQLDLISYIGSFVCWKWAHGVSLFLAPFEFLLPGSSISIYLANMLISAVTLVCLYRLLCTTFTKISSTTAALSCMIFILCPYSLSFFTYFCMDWHIVYFSVWLLYGIKEKNNILISFCGYLLAFTKITGIVFYAFILMCVCLFELYQDKENSGLLQKIQNWFSFSKAFLWILPAVFFLITFLYGDHFTAQNFYGTYLSDSMIELKSIEIIANTLIQAFVFGFRWIIILCVPLLIVWRKKISLLLSSTGTKLIVSISIACIAVLLLLCLYNSDAECPRYTLIINLLFTFIFTLTVLVLFQKTWIQNLLIVGMTVLLLFQTYWTIDPSIIFLSSAQIYTGKTEHYKMSVSKDDRPGMNLGTSYGKGIEVLGDLYTYNMEHAFYDDLLQKMLIDINPTSKDQFFVLDIIDYELHLSGSANRNYKIYWNSKTQQRTYNGNDEDSIYLNEKSITTDELRDKNTDLPNQFYLIVVSRVDAANAIENLNRKGYYIYYEFSPENLYGTLTVYGFKKK